VPMEGPDFVEPELLELPVRPPPTPGGGPWVLIDAQALPGGDGSEQAPFSSVAEALAAAPGKLLRLRTGMYRGPFELPAGTRLEGQGQVVLHAEGLAPVIRTGGALTLVGV